MKKNILIVGAIVALILFFDQFIKIYIKSHFEPGDDYLLIGSWFKLEYIENQGMAFGTTFGSQIWHKLALSIFRIGAIIGIAYYWFQQAKKGASLEFLIVLGLIFSGAIGNLIDSACYDYIFEYNPCMRFNQLDGSGIKTDCGVYGVLETRHHGFLLGNVVDMFKFEAFWPQWIPFLGGKEVFPAIWNLADFAITTGVIYIIIRNKKFFPKEPEVVESQILNEENN
jgi:signal peptidase II